MEGYFGNEIEQEKVRNGKRREREKRIQNKG